MYAYSLYSVVSLKSTCVIVWYGIYIYIYICFKICVYHLLDSMMIMMMVLFRFPLFLSLPLFHSFFVNIYIYIYYYYFNQSTQLLLASRWWLPIRCTKASDNSNNNNKNKTKKLPVLLLIYHVYMMMMSECCIPWCDEHFTYNILYYIYLWFILQWDMSHGHIMMVYDDVSKIIATCVS